MTFSSLKRPTCKAKCGRPPKLGYSGYCYTCCPTEIKEKVGTKRQAQVKRKNARLYASAKARSLTANKEMAERVKGNVDNELGLYFKLAATELSKNPICQECHSPIPEKIYTLKNNTWVQKDNYRNCTAHILFKAKFPSVASNPYNRLFLCAANGCHDKSHRLDTFSKMEIFGEAVRKFRLFENDIKESNKYLHAFKELADKI